MEGGTGWVDSPRAGRRLLRALFLPTVPWALLVLFAEELSRLPFERWARTSPLGFYGGVLGAGVLAVVALGSAWSWMLRRWPGFLHVPARVSLSSLLVRMLVFGPVVAILLAVAGFAAWWVFVVSGEDPAHSQYGLSAWWAGLVHAVALTPMGTVLVTWLSTRRGPDG